MTPTSAFTCPSCGFRFRVQNKYLGKIASCPADGCSQKIRLNAKASGESSPIPSTSRNVNKGKAQSGNSKPSRAANTVQSPLEVRRTQRLVRRRAASKLAQTSNKNKAMNPAWLGFGSVVAVAIVGSMVWTFVGDATTGAMLTDESGTSEHNVSGNSDNGRTTSDSHAILASLPASSSNQSTTDEKNRRRDEQAAATARHLNEQILPYMKEYCIDCHGPESANWG